MKYKILIISAFSLFVSGCTHNFMRHWTEVRTVEKGTFEGLRDAWIVEESIPTDEFAISLQPADSVTTPKGVFPVALLKGDQVPANERFIFAIIDPFSGKADARFEFEWQEGGMLKVWDRNGVRMENEIPFVAADGIVVSKPIIYGIVSKDKGTIATAEFIPYPLETKSENGAKASIVATHRMLTRFDARGEGFSPHETIRAIHRNSEKEEILDLVADENGSFILPLNPTVLGKLGGEASLVLVRENEELCLDYPWGAHLDKKTFEERSLFPVLFVVNRSTEEMDSQMVQNGILSSSYFN